MQEFGVSSGAPSVRRVAELGAMAASRLAAIGVMTIGVSALAADPWADRVVSYGPGVGADAAYGNAAVATGSPERFTGENTPFGPFPSSVTPFAGAFGTDEVVSIGRGGSLTVAFDEPVLNDPQNPYGIDLLVFGNSFFTNPQFAPVALGISADGGTVEISPDGATWYLVTGAVADGLFPTLGYIDESNPFGGLSEGLVPTDFTKPVDPSFNWVGQDLNGLIAGYAGSGGGAGIDIGVLGLSQISFVRVSLAADASGNIEIDAFSDVTAVPSPASAVLLVAAVALRRRRRGVGN